MSENSSKRFGFSDLLYPQRFFVRVFPETRDFALARMFAIGLSWLFFAIIVVSLFIVFLYKSQSRVPVILYYDSMNSKWSSIGAEENKKVSWLDLKARMDLITFIKDRYTVSLDSNQNLKNWCAVSDEENCDNTRNHKLFCSLSCEMSSGLYGKFVKTILPYYSKLQEIGAVMYPEINQAHLIQMSYYSEPKKNFFGQSQQVGDSFVSIWRGDFWLKISYPNGYKDVKKIKFYAELEQKDKNAFDFVVVNYFDYLDVGGNKCEN